MSPGFAFEEFPKIPRLKKGVVITEKLDGTNAQIAIFELTQESYDVAAADPSCLVIRHGLGAGDSPLAFYAGSRNRWITPGKSTDNFGFAGWVLDNVEELSKLGPGRHYGEWWGKGIGPRQYGLADRRFSLFNTARWNQDNPNRPACCSAVPVIPVDDPDEAMKWLKEDGSLAAPGFMNPEGIVVFHQGSRQLYKRTFDNDGGKWVA
jgi:hypothetical protein